MNSYMGGNQAYTAGYKEFGKLSEISDPAPSKALVFMDEREDSINDGYFAILMHYKGLAAQMPDWPGSYHNGAGTFSFADGHAELHKWRDGRTTPPPAHGSTLPNPVSPNNPVIAWIQDHATGLK